MRYTDEISKSITRKSTSDKFGHSNCVFLREYVERANQSLCRAVAMSRRSRACLARAGRTRSVIDLARTSTDSDERSDFFEHGAGCR